MAEMNKAPLNCFLQAQLKAVKQEHEQVHEGAAKLKEQQQVVVVVVVPLGVEHALLHAEVHGAVHVVVPK